MTTAGFTKTSLTNQHLQIAMETRRDTKKLISGQQAIARAIEQPSEMVKTPSQRRRSNRLIQRQRQRQTPRKKISL